MKCEICGSDIMIWDYTRGDIICPSCGTVICPIYEYRLTYFESLNKDRPRASGLKAKQLRIQEKLLKNKYSKSLQRLQLYSNISTPKKNIIVNESAFQEYLEGQRPRVKILMHEKDPELKKFIDENPELSKVLKVIENIPKLGSRTLRGKVAAAYTMYVMIQGMDPDPIEISKITGITTVHAKRIIAEVKKYRKLIERLKKFDYQSKIRQIPVLHTSYQVKLAT